MLKDAGVDRPKRKKITAAKAEEIKKKEEALEKLRKKEAVKRQTVIEKQELKQNIFFVFGETVPKKRKEVSGRIFGMIRFSIVPHSVVSD